jgi:hypothetical protein
VINVRQKYCLVRNLLAWNWHLPWAFWQVTHATLWESVVYCTVSFGIDSQPLNFYHKSRLQNGIGNKFLCHKCKEDLQARKIVHYLCGALARTTKSELKMWEVLSLNCTVLDVLNIVRLIFIIGYKLCIQVSRTQSDVRIKDSEQLFMNCGVWRNVLEVAMLPSDLLTIHLCVYGCLINWESSVEEVQMTMVQYISGGHWGGFLCTEFNAMQDWRGSVTVVVQQ